MRLSFVSFAVVFAVLSSCDAASVDQTKISKMATVGMAQEEVNVPADNRSLRDNKWTDTEEEERAISASIDDVVIKLSAQKSTLGRLIDKKKVDDIVVKAFANKLVKNKSSYLDTVFVKKNLNTMLTNEKYAFLEWHALGLSNEMIKSKLGRVGEHFETLFTQYSVFVSRLRSIE